jgi:hypothetical protein
MNTREQSDLIASQGRIVNPNIPMVPFPRIQTGRIIHPNPLPTSFGRLEVDWENSYHFGKIGSLNRKED